MSEAEDKAGQSQPTPSNEGTRVVPPGEFTPRFVEVFDRYLTARQAGKAPDRVQFIADHPDLAPQLEQALARLELALQDAEKSAPALRRIGDFRIVREVGRGGMGTVYEAEQISLKRRVALKVLHLGAAGDEVAMQRFQREAETVAHLHHTNIVPIFAVGREEGTHFFAMQFIDGQDLAELAHQSRNSGKGIHAQTIARWGLQAAEALAHAHQRGVIHRD